MRIGRWMLALGMSGLVLWPSSADASTWVSGFNDYVGYYMPGPPPGSYLSACYVVSENGVDLSGSPQASINPQSDSYSACSGGYASAVFQIPGGIGESASTYTPANGTAVAWGPEGDADIGAVFAACNIYGYCLSWGTTWISNGTDSRSSYQLNFDYNRVMKIFINGVKRQLPTPRLSASIQSRWTWAFRQWADCMRVHGVPKVPGPPARFGNGTIAVPIVSALGPLHENARFFQTAFGECSAFSRLIPAIIPPTTT